MNQLLRLPLLKHTHTQKKKTDKKKSSPILCPQEKRRPVQHPQMEVPMAAVKE